MTEVGTAIKTDGVGSSTKSHLNLSVSLADVWNADEAWAAYVRRSDAASAAWDRRKAKLNSNAEASL